jgi:DNA-binding transcriptional MocR family regulator
MTPDRASLETHFAGVGDQELLERLGSGELTELARDVALAEARKRDLYLAALRADADATGVEVAHGHGPLCICARYLMPLDAQVLAARLQAEGLAATVMDSDTIYSAGALFGSLPRGGVRVMVPESQLEQAKRIREKFDAGDYAIDENFDPDAD